MRWAAGIIRRTARLLPGVFPAVVCALFGQPQVVSAQGFSTPGPVAPAGAYGGGGHIFAPSAGGYAVPHPISPGYPCADGLQGVGYSAPGGNIVTMPVPVDDSELEPLPIETFINTAVENMWFRWEYINWSIERPGNDVLGTRTLDTENTREFFEVIGGFARAPDLREIGLESNNGNRMTLGIPLQFATLESSFFILEQASDSEIPRELPSGAGPDPLFITIPTTVNGELSNFVRFFDERYRATYTSDIWGGEMNVVMHPFNAPFTGEGLKIRPLVGIRYINVHEALVQRGTNAAGGLFSVIDSDVMNHLYGVNLGLRTELVHRWFTIGVAPKVALGLNTYRAQVISEGFVTPGEPRFVTDTIQTDFAAIMDLALYGRVHINENISLVGGYNVMWLSRLARPHDTIVYDTNGVLGVPVSTNIHAKEGETNMWMQGFSAGLEIRFK